MSALTSDGKLDERHQKALTRYYIASGAGGLAVGVHTTQFAIHNPKIGLYQLVLELASETARECAEASNCSEPVMIAGILGNTENAIKEAHREIGVLEKGHRNGIVFIHGRLRVGEAMSPPLIKKVRKYAGENGLTIIDAPPGTSCPVIAAMKGADFIILVTEPTPFGLHDLNLAAGAVKLLDIPCGIIINRSDLGDSSVKEFAEKEKIPLLMEIPFDRQIAEFYSRGELIVENIPEWKEKFFELYQKIKVLMEH